MKKILIVMIMIGFVLTGCSQSKPAKALHILSPSGAPALSLLGSYKDVIKEGEVKIVEGSDIISSELVKKDGTYDVIIAPINLGCQLIAKGQTDYKLAGVVTWGNLYLVENEGVKNNQMAAFGEQTVPGKIFNTVKESSDVIKNSEVTFYNAVSDVQAQMLAGKVQYGLMAEPTATATIAKAKENKTTLKITASLQELYQKQTNAKELGYPQAAVFVKNKQDVSDFLTKLGEFTDGKIAFEGLFDEIDLKTFGVPSATIAEKTWTNQNIHYKDALTVKEDIKTLLEHFKIEYSDDMLI